MGLMSPKASVLNDPRYSAVDLDNHLIQITSFWDRDHFCRKRGHLKVGACAGDLLCQTEFKKAASFQDDNYGNSGKNA
jgi:hypothetical protein